MEFFLSIHLTRLVSLFNKLSAYAFMLFFVLLISGCAESITGVSPTPEDTDPEPQFEKVYDLKLTTKFI